MNFKFQKSLSFILLIFATHIANGSNVPETQFSQKYTYKRYSLADGLPQMQVTHLTQDQSGYIWVSHWNGISRFDGFDFVNFSQNEGLNGVAAFHSIAINKDQLAVIGFKGISIGGTKGFKGYNFPKSVKGDRNAYLFKIGNKLLITNLINIDTKKRATYYFNLQSFEFQPIDFVSKTFIREVIVHDKFVFIYTDKNYFGLDSTNLELLVKRSWKREYEDFAISPSNKCYAYCRKSKKLYRIAINNQLNAKEIETPYFIDNLNHTNRFNRFTVNAQDKIVWFDNNYELFLTDEYTTESTGKKFGIIRNFLNDREGNLWIASEEGMYNFYKFYFQKIKIFPGELSDMIWSIAQNKNEEMLFASSNRGLYKQIDNDVEKVDLSPYKFSDEPLIDVDKAYFGATNNSNGEPLIPFKNCLLHYKDGDHIKRIPIDGSIQMLIKDEESDTIFGASSSGIVKITPDGEYRKITKGFSAYQNESIAEDKYGRLWVGSTLNNTIQIYDNEHVKEWSDSTINTVISLSTDVNSNIWIANHNGVFIYDYNKVTALAPNLINKPIYNIIPYNDSIMVLGGGNELFIVNVKSYYNDNKQDILRFSINKGFDAEECVQNSYCITNDNTLYIPAVNACYKFNPTKFQNPTKSQTLIIDKVLFSSTDDEWEEFAPTSNLKAKDRNLKFSFIDINFSERNNVTYRYRLNGFEEDWNDPTKQRNAIYKNMDYGLYNFEVQSSIDLVNWSDSVYTQEIELAKKYYELWWFKLIQFLFVGLLFFLLSKFYFEIRKKRYLLRHKQIHEITNLRLANIKSQLNPHFIFNVMNHVGLDILKSKNEKGYNHFVKLSTLIRENLEETDIILKTVADEISFVRKYLELQKYRFGDKLEYQIIIDEEIDKGYQIPRMCIQILVENAVKHAIEPSKEVGKLIIFGEMLGKGFRMGVKDNGGGFSNNAETSGTGKGLTNLKRMLNIYNKYNTEKSILEINSTNSGSEVYLFIPNNYRFFLGKNDFYE